MQLTVDSGQMPVGWRIKTLDELCHIARGGSPRPIKQFITNAPNGVNWIKISDASSSSKYIYETKEKIIPNGVKHSRLVSEGDFILSNSMSFGRPYIMRTSGCIHDGWLVLKDKSGLFDQDYLYYFLGSSTTYKQFDVLATGSTVRNLNIDLVRGVKVTLPPLLEQKRIVAILDEAFEGIDRAIANTEKNLTNARKLFESYLNAIFTQKGDGWVEKKLEDICKEITVGHVGSMASKYKDSGIPFLRSQNILPFRIKLDNVVFINNEFHSALKKSQLRPGDLAIVRAGYPGTAAVIPEELKIVNCSDLVIVKPGENINSHYLCLFFNSIFGKTLVGSRLVGAAQKHFNITTAKKVFIPFPCLTEQNCLVSKMDELAIETQRLETIYRQKITALNELKQSILQKAFTGELTADTANQVKKTAQRVNAA